MGDAAGHYFEPEPAVASAPRRVRLDLPDRSATYTTDRGVFAAAGVDAATKYLLLDAPAPPLSGTFLDLGCGYGPIACTLAARRPEATVWAVDVNRRAVDLCAANADAQGLGNVTAAAPEAASAGPFDLIWSNPPIRIGKDALHDMLHHWLGRLRPGATAVLVVHRHLGSDSLQRWLDTSGWPTRRLGSRDGNRLLEVTAP
jgi:16S rRNA (guanine1207-N2)-methyltransferase